MAIRFYDLVGSDAQRPFSPHCWKVRMALAHKGLEAERVPVRFTDIPTIEGGKVKTVPAMSHDGKLVVDSFSIALHLRDALPDSGEHLFLGEGAVGLSRFVEAWTNTQLHGWVRNWVLMDIHNMLDPIDQAYFRKSRQERYGKSLEEIVANREASIPDFLNRLEPLRTMLGSQPYLGGTSPLFADYIVFGAFQWLRVCSGLAMIPKDEPVLAWVERMLDLHDGLARSTPEAIA